jgi:hypothetical protein
VLAIRLQHARNPSSCYYMLCSPAVEQSQEACRLIQAFLGSSTTLWAAAHLQCLRQVCQPAGATFTFSQQAHTCKRVDRCQACTSRGLLYRHSSWNLRSSRHTLFCNGDTTQLLQQWCSSVPQRCRICLASRTDVMRASPHAGQPHKTGAAAGP